MICYLQEIHNVGIWIWGNTLNAQNPGNLGHLLDSILGGDFPRLVRYFCSIPYGNQYSCCLCKLIVLKKSNFYSFIMVHSINSHRGIASQRGAQNG